MVLIPTSKIASMTLSMCPQDERHALLIDRAAAEVPRDEAIGEWARNKRAFISSVIAELAEQRAAAADGVRWLGARPVMFEEFGGPRVVLECP